ncbi:UBP-type zinc finger domain-containing protein [Pengzhenrongella sicca]|uniref:UBP-type zinc finger domain-containing protein n=1 Tax=Pengzhenrongella sicca TaxID=2819238 RepID=A0A8A4ZB27_9MICO|nr:UBP-type zinc finger domain-containing protein [Pengzhenrongella sicca]QTE27786.1 UBP-type zinc finger domain-containing protein [Pengzhenrongella sicca]
MDTPGIDPHVAPSGPGCAACEELGGWWFHLRRCAQCGLVGCCDSSPAQHASRHAREQGHPWIRSYEPGETWFYSYPDDAMSEGPELAAPLHHPVGQASPGPLGRVPDDWRQRLNR